MTRLMLKPIVFSGLMLLILTTSPPAVRSEDQAVSEQPGQQTSEDQPAQGEVQERGVLQFPGARRQPAPAPGQPPAPPQGSPFQAPPAATRQNSQMPLAQHPQGQQMMATALKNASLVDINFQFLNKTYEDDIYGPREPITGKRPRLSCVRLKATSGFRLRVDPPQFALSMQGLTISENISKITANGITIKWQLGPCMEHAGGFGIHLSDVKFVYKARPTLTLDPEGFCKLTWNQDPDQFRVAIGGMNILGLQNDLDKLAKNAVREGLNFTLDGIYGSLVRNELTKVVFDVCGNKLSIRNK